jgi:hypothetical protein
MFTDDLAEKLKERAGEKYRPSNGTEGEMFMEKFCYNCQHDDPDNEKFCEILTRTMAFDVDEDEYPKEWQYGTDGQPVCTEFKNR